MLCTRRDYIHLIASIGVDLTMPTTERRHHRELTSGDVVDSSSVCHQSGTFLGVGNVDCLHQHLGTVIFLLAVIIIVSLLFERLIHSVRQAIPCPQLKRIVNRIFEEVMIMGFISMLTVFSRSTPVD